MTLSLNGGIHEVLIFKDGKRWDTTNFPALFKSIAGVTVKFGNELLGTTEIAITPSLDDAVKILQSGLLGIGMTQKGQAPQSTAAAATSKTVTPKSTESLVSTPKAGGAGNSELAESIYPVVAVRFLYAGQTDNDGTEASTPWFVGIMNVPEVNFTESDITITIKASSSAVLASKFIATARFENQPMYDAIKKLVDPFGLKITFDEDDTQTEELLNSLTYTGISSEPPMTTVQNILLQADCYFALINGDDKNPTNEIRIKSRKSVNEGKIDFTFVLYRQIDPARNVYPITAMSLNSNGALFLPGGAFGSSQSGIDSSTKKTVNLEVNDRSNDTKGLTGNDAGMNRLPGDSGATFGVNNGLVSNPPDVKISGSNDPVLQNGSLSNKPEIESRALTDGSLGLSYTLTVPGLPKLRSMRLAQVIIGDNIAGISGPGQIYWITHRTGGGNGWESEIDFRRQPGLVDGASLDRRKTESVPRPANGTSKSAIPI